MLIFRATTREPEKKTELNLLAKMAQDASHFKELVFEEIERKLPTQAQEKVML